MDVFRLLVKGFVVVHPAEKLLYSSVIVWLLWLRHFDCFGASVYAVAGGNGGCREAEGQ